MNDQHTTGRRNLVILSWMGLACQAFGVLGAISDMVGLRFGSVLGGTVMFVFGLALAGWAGNFREIVDLKQRVAKLEGRASETSK